MKDERKRGHVGTVTWGHGAHIRGPETRLIGEMQCSKGAAWGDRMIGWGHAHFRVSGLGNRVTGTGSQVRVRVRVLNLDLMPNT